MVQTVVRVAGTVSAARARAIELVGRDGAPTAGSDGNRESLDDTTLTGALAWVHAVVDGEVAADHVSPSGGGILGQLIRFVLNIGRVFPVVHSYRAAVA